MWPFMILFSGQCLGMVVEGGYMFVMDPDMSSFPRITWHCPKYKTDGCPASFVTKVKIHIMCVGTMSFSKRKHVMMCMVSHLLHHLIL